MYLRGLVMRYKSFFSSSASKQKSSYGFGLIELMVSISIMTLVSTVILVKNRSFNNALILRNQAYEIAFSLRQAQLMAVSGTKEVTASNRNTYGVHFSVGTTPGNKQYRIFRDDQGLVNWYNSNDVTIGGTVGTIDNNFIIDITNSAGNGASISNTLSITFTRPNFDAKFVTSSLGATLNGPVYLKVMPKNATGYSTVPYRLIEITRTGQITVL